jgi:hypothetical protein
MVRDTTFENNIDGVSGSVGHFGLRHFLLSPEISACDHWRDVENATFLAMASVSVDRIVATTEQ